MWLDLSALNRNFALILFFLCSSLFPPFHFFVQSIFALWFFVLPNIHLSVLIALKLFLGPYLSLSMLSKTMVQVVLWFYNIFPYNASVYVIPVIPEKNLLNHLALIFAHSLIDPRWWSWSLYSTCSPILARTHFHLSLSLIDPTRWWNWSLYSTCSPNLVGTLFSSLFLLNCILCTLCFRFLDFKPYPLSLFSS